MRLAKPPMPTTSLLRFANGLTLLGQMQQAEGLEMGEARSSAWRFRARKLSRSVSRPCIPACASRLISLRPEERIPYFSSGGSSPASLMWRGEVVVDTLAVRSRDVGAAPATIEDGDPGPGRLHVGGTDLGLGIDLVVDELVGRLGVRVGAGSAQA